MLYTKCVNEWFKHFYLYYYIFVWIDCWHQTSRGPFVPPAWSPSGPQPSPMPWMSKKRCFSSVLGVFGHCWGSDPNIMGTIQTGSVSAFQKGHITVAQTVWCQWAISKRWQTEKVRIVGGSDPEVMGTIESGSVLCFQKGLTHLCSSNGLASAGD